MFDIFYFRFEFRIFYFMKIIIIFFFVESLENGYWYRFRQVFIASIKRLCLRQQFLRSGFLLWINVLKVKIGILRSGVKEQWSIFIYDEELFFRGCYFKYDFFVFVMKIYLSRYQQLFFRFFIKGNVVIIFIR